LFTVDFKGSVFRNSSEARLASMASNIMHRMNKDKYIEKIFHQKPPALKEANTIRVGSMTHYYFAVDLYFFLFSLKP
jgi:hypothetical protein